MFSGKHEIPKHNGCIFIDREGEAFINMINFLRNDKIPHFRNTNEEIQFMEELEFWCIPLNESKDFKVFYLILSNLSFRK